MLVTVNNPVTRFLLVMSAPPPSESDFKAALAELESAKKGDERLGAHLQALYLTTCEKCGKDVQAQSFLWRKGEETPFARVYKCPQCGDSGEKLVTDADVKRYESIASTAGLHGARLIERVAKPDDPDRVYGEEALSAYTPRAVFMR